MQKGFTLVELMVVIAIIVILAGIILFSVKLYINKGKDANVSGNLVILIPAGEVYYNGFPNAYGDSNSNFCQSSVAVNAFAQMPLTTIYYCNVEPNYYQAWAACAKEFSNPSMALCVDSRGIKEDISNDLCNPDLTQCP